MGDCDCGVPRSSACLCKQLARPADEARARTLWLGSINEDEDEHDIDTLFAPQHLSLSSTSSSNLLEQIVIRRNRWTTADGRRQGFALIRFENEAEASKVLASWTGDKPLRAHRWERSASDTTNVGLANTSASAASTSNRCHPSEGKEMPSLEAQFEPLTETQLRARLALHGNPSCPDQESMVMASGGRLAKKALLKGSVASLYRLEKAPRRLRFARGVPIPEPYLGDMIAALEKLQWPPQRKNRRGRKGVEAEQYLILGRSSAEQPQAKAEAIPPHHIRVWNAATTLLSAMLEDARSNDVRDESKSSELFKATSLVVTKNFTGSPHVDARDVTWQYAAAFGNYGPREGNPSEASSASCEVTRGVGVVAEGDIPSVDHLRGGELCVESESGAEVFIVDTHNRLVRCDGRHVHWVRGYESGCRYSVIWYRVAGPKTEPLRAVYNTLL